MAYIYALANPAMSGLVKIGKTDRVPELRVDELSAATGVPGKFLLLHAVEVSDCDEAERYIHKKLEACRYERNREFFQIKISEAIHTLDECAEMFKAGIGPSASAPFPPYDYREFERRIGLLSLSDVTKSEMVRGSKVFGYALRHKDDELFEVALAFTFDSDGNYALMCEDVLVWAAKRGYNFPWSRTHRLLTRSMLVGDKDVAAAFVKDIKRQVSANILSLTDARSIMLRAATSIQNPDSKSWLIAGARTLVESANSARRQTSSWYEA
jgi:hypothetical protein